MTLDEIRDRLAAIKATVGDPESAHGEEDDLWADVLEAIAAGAPNPAELAAEALKSREIDFPHWYA